MKSAKGRNSFILDLALVVNFSQDWVESEFVVKVKKTESESGNAVENRVQM